MLNSRLKPLYVPALAVLGAAVSLWLGSQPYSLAWRRLAIGFAVLGVGAIAYTLWRRQTSTVTSLSPAAWRRLALVTAILLALALSVTGLWVANARANGLVHPARIPIDRTPESVGITDYEPVSFLSSDGLTLRGWYVPPHNGAVVIFVHGLGSNRTELLDEAGLLAARGYGALLFDSRNQGESEGTVTTLGLREVNDVSGAVDFVLAQPGASRARIALFGHSMGGGTVVLAGADIPQVSAVVAESAYTSVEDNVSESIKQLTGLPPFPFAPLVVFFGQRQAGAEIAQVRPIDRIASISPRPVLLVHGDQDEILSVSNAYNLYAAAREPKELYIIAGAGHSNLLQTEPEEYARRIVGFLDKYLLVP